MIRMEKQNDLDDRELLLPIEEREKPVSMPITDELLERADLTKKES